MDFGGGSGGFGVVGVVIGGSSDCTFMFLLSLYQHGIWLYETILHSLVLILGCSSLEICVRC